MLPLESLAGRIVDADSHLMLFSGTAKEILGDGPGGGPWQSRRGGGSIVEEIRQMMIDEGLDPDGPGEALVARREASRNDPWAVKLWGAHGAQLAADRVDALDRMGIDRQLVFSQFMESPLNTPGREAQAAVARYNDYVLDWAKAGRGRLLPVCLINSHDRLAALKEVRRVLDGGATGVQLSGILPPASISPAAAEWEPLWAMLADSGVPALFHYGGTGGGSELAIHESWYRAANESLRPPGDDPDADDFHAAPFIWMTAHVYAEITLTFLVLGGVLERHPGLRIGVVESGGSWVAPWCARMDNLATTTSRYLGRTLSLRPSEYVRRQVRVAPFPFEPVASWIERSGLEEVYVFSTDYPHVEGGVRPVDAFYPALARLGPEVTERFFVTNGLSLTVA
ncbi:MAG TPA: amidohydrolase family protein [Acidimicrobiales bacterium]|jgi:predicted TIM-barrel fold metal-dependent hydrolase|nr:amidohydrolase family protein [Acidimicrobiales bacterium]